MTVAKGLNTTNYFILFGLTDQALSKGIPRHSYSSEFTIFFAALHSRFTVFVLCVVEVFLSAFWNKSGKLTKHLIKIIPIVVVNSRCLFQEVYYMHCFKFYSCDGMSSYQIDNIVPNNKKLIERIQKIWNEIDLTSQIDFQYG